jgi:Flp pilus assembly protein TadG
MLRATYYGRRRATTALECSVIFPITFFLTFSIIIGGLGVFRYQEVASLAREGARYAAVHGTQYATDSGKTAATAADVYNNAIQPHMVSLDPSKLNYTVTWANNSKAPGSTVTVTVSYTWVPELYLIGPYTLSSTAKMTVCY